MEHGQTFETFGGLHNHWCHRLGRCCTRGFALGCYTLPRLLRSKDDGREFTFTVVSIDIQVDYFGFSLPPPPRSHSALHFSLGISLLPDVAHSFNLFSPASPFSEGSTYKSFFRSLALERLFQFAQCVCVFAAFSFPFEVTMYANVYLVGTFYITEKSLICNFSIKYHWNKKMQLSSPSSFLYLIPLLFCSLHIEKRCFPEHCILHANHLPSVFYYR